MSVYRTIGPLVHKFVGLFDMKKKKNDHDIMKKKKKKKKKKNDHGKFFIYRYMYLHPTALYWFHLHLLWCIYFGCLWIIIVKIVKILININTLNLLAHDCCVLCSQIYVCGGVDRLEVKKNVWCYDPARNNWSKRAPLNSGRCRNGDDF